MERLNCGTIPSAMFSCGIWADGVSPGQFRQGTHDVFLWFTAPFASRQQGFQRAQQGDNAYDAEDMMAIRVTALFIWLP
mgnify:CR=1 FL=1